MIFHISRHGVSNTLLQEQQCRKVELCCRYSEVSARVFQRNTCFKFDFLLEVILTTQQSLLTLGNLDGKTALTTILEQHVICTRRSIAVLYLVCKLVSKETSKSSAALATMTLWKAANSATMVVVEVIIEVTFRVSNVNMIKTIKRFSEGFLLHTTIAGLTANVILVGTGFLEVYRFSDSSTILWGDKHDKV